MKSTTFRATSSRRFVRIVTAASRRRRRRWRSKCCFLFFSLILGAFSYPSCPSEARVSPVATGMELSYGFSPTLRRHSLAVKMDAPGILTTCAACAAPLAHDAPRCVRCKLRYCNATCQHDHWRRGHKQICKKIHRGGNAETYHADKKYKEAVAVAFEASATTARGASHATSVARP